MEVHICKSHWIVICILLYEYFISILGKHVCALGSSDRHGGSMKSDFWHIFILEPIVIAVTCHVNYESKGVQFSSVQFSSAAQSCPTLCDSMNCSMPGLPLHHQLLDFTQTHVHRVSDAIQPSHPLLSPSPVFSLFQHQGLFQWVSSSCQVAKVLEFQLRHQVLQWTSRTDLL